MERWLCEVLRMKQKLSQGWFFTGSDGREISVNLPHTWNALDGQDGGNDYYRGTCSYRTSFSKPSFDSGNQRVYLEFQGVNASAEVQLNGNKVMEHDNGYST